LHSISVLPIVNWVTDIYNVMREFHVDVSFDMKWGFKELNTYENSKRSTA